MLLAPITLARLAAIDSIDVSIDYSINFKILKILVKLPFIVYIVYSYYIYIESVVEGS